ncbi:MAG: alpha/beta fold hydrolase [Planctomycetes bacterium]|nr:alpha/beta fold hydrolase [Planctomycetota bacterium]
MGHGEMQLRNDGVGRTGFALVIRRYCQDAVCIVGVLALPLVCGCGPTRYVAPDRLAHGYTVILPGIEGASYLNRNVAKGLISGGWPGAVEVYDWTAGTILLFPVNLRALDRNKHEAAKVARKIMDYQDRHPDQPVHIIGHSGGGGVALLALEALPPERQITSALLLAPAVSPDYDLRRALRRTQHGVWNFYSRHDVGFLKAGTTLMGTIDGRHTSAAGAVGFQMPWGLDDADRRLYSHKLRQQPYSRKMADSGNTGGHTGWANRQFVSEWLCPIMIAQAGEHAAFAADDATSENPPRRQRSGLPRAAETQSGVH